MKKFNVMFMILCIFASISIIPWTYAFNVETKHYTIYSEEQYSMFGFSVAEHLSRDYRGWVIVGAPEAQTIQNGVTRGGAVYRCETDKDHSCQPIHFDLSGNNVNSNPEAAVEVDNKTMQWFGASVATSYVPDGPILACAPRYMWYSANFQRREPVGTCYITEHSFSGPKEFSPCRTKHWGYHRQGSCQAGLGAALSKDGERVLIGAPGSFYWQGQMYSVDSKAEFTYMPPRLAHFGESPGQAFSGPTSTLPRVVRTEEGQAKDDDTYLGYSVTTGDFEGTGETGAAVGMPRGNGLHGQVVIFAADLKNHQRNLTGDQMGEYFGYSVISGDINGDGLDDLIIGAPMYTIDNPGETFETGRVHIYYQENGQERFTRTETRIGFKSKSRFGLSLASLKDIDQDGFGDFAVGAPYDGPDGRGAVYIYHGSKDGVLKTFSQVIYAEDVRPKPSTFGFSIAGGLDLDGNSYPDMVVGAYESSLAAFYRSRPVIKMEAFVEFDSKSQSISLEEKDCVLSNRVSVACLRLNTCLTYKGTGVASSYEFNVEYALDTKKSKNRRLFFIEHEGQSSINKTVRLSRDEELCKSFSVYVDYNITDKLTSIDAEMRMSLKEDYATGEQFRNPKAPLTPILGATTSRPDTLSIFKSCGSDNICIPNLILNVTSGITKYLLASGDRLEIDVLVNNTGEHAYESLFYLEQPPGIEYINIERINKTGITVQCSAPSEHNNKTLMCDIGNPLPKNESVHFKVILQPMKTEGLKAYYELNMGVNSTNPELNGTQADNKVSFRMPIWIQTEIVIEGTSRPRELYYNADNYTVENITNEWEFGPLLTHNYTIRNDGPSEIKEAEAFLTWPAATLAGEELLYLIDMPETAGPIICGPANADYLSLKLEKKAMYQPTAGSSGTTDVDRINQLAEEERRKQNEEQLNFGLGNGTRDYNYDTETEVLVNSGGSKNHSSTYFRNYTNSGGGYTSEGHSSTYVEAHGSGRQNNENQQNESNRLRIQQQREEEARTLRLQQQREEEERRVRLQQQREEEERRVRLQQQREEEERLRIESDGRRYENQGISGGGSERQSNDDQERERLENERRRIENERIEAEERQRSLDELRRREDERLRTEEIARQHLENQHWGIERHETYDRTEIPETYGVQRHYTTDTENSSGHRTGYVSTSGGIHREGHEQSTGNSGLNVNLSNLGYSRELEEFLSTPNHESARMTTYTRDGQTYVRFGGRFRLRGGEDFIQLENGQDFAVLDRYDRPSHSNGQSQGQHDYSNMEGKLVGGDNGNVYIELGDGRKFRVPGTYSHQRTRTFSSHVTGQGTGYGSPSGEIHREEHEQSTGNSGLNINLSNIGSSKDLEKFFSTLNRQAAAMTTYTRGGQEYVQFSGRLIVRDRQDYIEFKDGQTFAVLDSHGDQSYSTGEDQSDQSYSNIEGKLVGGEDGNIYVELKDGRKFRIPGTYSYQRTRTYSVGGGPHETVQSAGKYTYGKQVTHGGSSGEVRPHGGHNYREESYSQEYKSGRKMISDLNAGGFDSMRDNFDIDDVPTNRPEDRLNRYARESDVLSIEQFRKLEKRQRQKREDVDTEGNSNFQRSRRDEPVHYGASDVIGRGQVSSCKSAECVKLECTFGPLKKDQEVFIKVRYRVKAKTLNKIAANEKVKVSTQLITRVTRQEFLADTPDEELTRSHEIITIIHPSAAPAAPDVIPLWVVVLSACAGTIILLLLIFLLYKMGFFKRNRPNSAPERQPLNKNGHYSNDD